MPSLTQTEEAWYDYPNDPLGGRVKIRLVKDGEIQDLAAKLSKQRYVETGVDGEMELVIEPRDSRLSLTSELAMASIVDWEGFTDGKATKKHPNGEQLPCTKANKRLFCLEPDFVNVISRLHQAHKANWQKHQKALEKNLKK